MIVTGELSNFKQHGSGHRYFTLKDADAQISCVMWRSRTMSFIPEDGMKVMITGKITVYPQHGKYQIDCVSIRPHGLGDLHIAFEALKKKLQAAGWFDAERKRALPDFPITVGIATSGTGAAYHDMVSTLARRYPAIHVVFRPTVVQGPNAAPDIVQALADLERAEVDVIIVGRGGGSLEDLWCFNEEMVARAIIESSVPVISAVGHETDFTIADFVADFRAATPTAAAEAVSPYTARDVDAMLQGFQNELTQIITVNLIALQDITESFVDGRAMRRVLERLSHKAQRVDELEERLGASLLKSIERYRESISQFFRTTLLLIQHSLTASLAKVNHSRQLLASHHPLTPLRKGFAIISVDGTVINSATPLVENSTITITRQHETANATITSVKQIETQEIQSE